MTSQGKGIPVDDLHPETRQKLGIDKNQVPQRVVVLGKLLQAIEGLTTRDALWSLRTAHSYARGYRKPKTKVPNGKGKG